MPMGIHHHYHSMHPRTQATQILTLPVSPTAFHQHMY